MLLVLPERTLPCSIVVNRHGMRFTNEAANYNALGWAFHQLDAQDEGRTSDRRSRSATARDDAPQRADTDPQDKEAGRFNLRTRFFVCRKPDV